MRILDLKLYFGQPKEAINFYRDLFGTSSVDVPQRKWKAGDTVIRFEKTKKPVPYHFALNISCNKIEAATEFLDSSPCEIIEYEGKKIVEFPNWNARSVYFYDPAGNIVELIARRDLKNPSEGAFTHADIAGVSEIGTPCGDVEAAFSLLSDHTRIAKYDGNMSTFCAAGDPEGLFILTHTDRYWFPTETPSDPAPYDMVAEIHGTEYRFAFDGKAIMLLV